MNLDSFQGLAIALSCASVFFLGPFVFLVLLRALRRPDGMQR